MSPERGPRDEHVLAGMTAGGKGKTLAQFDMRPFCARRHGQGPAGLP